MPTEYAFLSINRWGTALMISVGSRGRVAQVPLTERDLIEIISRSAAGLEYWRKRREEA